MAKIARNQAFAKPERVALALESDIRSGLLQHGAKLDSESELVRRFAVSRTTVRKGLEQLSEKGLITTRTGIGSFVTFGGEIIDNRIGWTRALANWDEAVETKLLRLEIVVDAAAALRLDLGIQSFVAIDRLRLLARSGKVVSIERSMVPYWPQLANVPLSGLTGGSLSATLTEAGLLAASGEEWAEVARLENEDAALMGAAPAAAVLRTRRLVRDHEGRVIEYVVSLLDPDYFALHLEY